MKGNGRKKTLGYTLGGLFLLMMLLCAGCGKRMEPMTENPEFLIEENRGKENRREEQDAKTSEPAPRLDFPIEIEDGKLKVESVFQYSGLNLDYNDEVCENIGAIQLQNSSEDYLERAEVTVHLSEGELLKFVVEDIPIGKSVIAFESRNMVYDVTQAVTEINAEVIWNSEASLQTDRLELTEDGMSILVKNVSQETLKDLVVKYHCSFENVYFGGISYEQTIEELETGSAVQLDASECYFGEVKVVNVINN